ncbi:MAG: hypothetical protein ACREN7_02785 [Candidatus Dormibacteria bacterium]
MAFKRASLSGSAQLFQPTRVPTNRRRDAPPEPVALRARTAVSPLLSDSDTEPVQAPVLGTEPGADHGHLYRLTDEDVEMVLAALQHAKFPHSYQRMPKPAMEEFESLEELRQKFQEQREVRG